MPTVNVEKVFQIKIICKTRHKDAEGSHDVRRNVRQIFDRSHQEGWFPDETKSLLKRSIMSPRKEPKPKQSKTNAMTPSRRVPKYIRLRLVREAGDKCANPGCFVRLVEIHHINEWHVYKTHDETQMIAICPTCHKCAHRGTIKIDDSTIRRWKTIKRSEPTRHSQIYVEPGGACIRLGTIHFAKGQNNDGYAVFNFSSKNRLEFRLVDGDYLAVTLSLSDANGTEVISVSNNYLRHSTRDDIKYEQRPGRHTVSVPATEEFIPSWVMEKFNCHFGCDDPIVIDGRITVIDLEVIDRGLVGAKGLWAENEEAVISTAKALYVCTKAKGGFVSMQTGPNAPPNMYAVLTFDGPFNMSLFEVLFSGQL